MPLLAYAILPVALRFVVPEMLAARGLPAAVSWGYLDLWKLELVLVDLRIGPESGPAITFAEFRADLVRDALVQGRIELTDLRLRGASFDIDDLSATRFPGSGDHVPFEQVQLNDLRLAGLSERLGRDVVVRHALLERDVRTVDPGIRLEVDVDAGGAPVEIRGTLHEDGDTRILEGTLSASGLPARLLDPAPPDASSTWSGSVYSAADFELRLEAPSARANLKAIGSLHTAGVAARLGNLSFTEVDSVWEGTLTLSGPAFGPPERIYFQGTLDAREARVGEAGGSSNALLSGLRWKGIGGWHGVPVAAGEGNIDSIEFSGVFAGPGAVRADADRVQLRATLDDAGRYRLEQLLVHDLLAEVPDHDAEVRVQGVEALDLHAEMVGIRVDRLHASTLTVTTESEEGPRSWVVERPALARVAIAPSADARIDGATLESLRLRDAGVDVAALGARMEGIRVGRQGRIDVDIASLDILERLDDGGQELGIRDFHAKALGFDGDGGWEAAVLRANRISGAGSGEETWTALGLEAGGVQRRSGATGAGEAALESLVYRGEADDAFEGAGLRARSLEVRSEGGQAGRLEAQSLRYRTPGGASWEARTLSFVETQWQESGSRSAARTDATELRYRSASGERWRFDALQLGFATLGTEGTARIESAGARRTALVLPSGEALEALGLRSGPTERDAAGGFELSNLEVERLGSRMPDGLEWRARPLQAESLATLGDGRVEARGLRSASMSLHDGQGGRWQASGIAARRLDWHLLQHRLAADPLELERLEFTAAGGATWGANTLSAIALDWPPGRAPRIRQASAAALEGRTATGLAWRLEDLQATGDPDSGSEPSGVLDLSAGAGHLESESDNSRLAWSELRAAGLDIDDPERFATERLVFGDAVLDAGPDSQASLTASRIDIEGLEHEDGRLATESVTVDESVARIGVTETGEWMLPSWPAATGTKSPWALEIDELENGGHNRATFIDRSAEPPFEIDIDPYRLRVTGLDRLTPQRAAFLEVEGSLNASARLEVRGELRPRREGFDARVRVRLDGLDLHLLSDYARRQLGVAVRAGRGDVDFDVGLSGGELDATGELVLRNAALDPVPSGGAAGESFAEGIRRLAGPGGRVELHVSVQGPLADPDFDFPAAAARALARSAGIDPAAGVAETAPSSDH